MVNNSRTMKDIYSDLIQIVKVVEKNTDNTWKCLRCYVNSEGQPVPSPINDRTIDCVVLNAAPLVVDRLYVAYQLRPGRYLIHNQSVFLELDGI